MIKNFTILGERNSGTNFLEKAITINFDLPITWKFGWKHFFGYNDYKDSNETLFIAIVRDPVDWLNSMYRTPHHLQEELRTSPENFLTKQFWSYYDGKQHEKNNGMEIIEDRNIYTHERYKNIFECRNVKNKFLLDDMHHKVEHYVLIRYEDLRDNYDRTLEDICLKYNLPKKHKIYISIKNSTKYGKIFVINKNHIIKDINIVDKLDKDLEKRMGYNY